MQNMNEDNHKLWFMNFITGFKTSWKKYVTQFKKRSLSSNQLYTTNIIIVFTIFLLERLYYSVDFYMASIQYRIISSLMLKIL